MGLICARTSPRPLMSHPNLPDGPDGGIALPVQRRASWLPTAEQAVLHL